MVEGTWPSVNSAKTPRNETVRRPQRASFGWAAPRGAPLLTLMGQTGSKRPDVRIYDGFEEKASRILYPYADHFEHLSEMPPPEHMTILATGLEARGRGRNWSGNARRNYAR
eukprot:3843168-Prymnesium_polylepis.1